jgi:uncharacterized GH25 family protein
MEKFRSLWTITGLALATASVCQGHELKVLASRLATPKAGDRTTVYLSWGHTLPVDDLTDSKALERYDWLSPAGKATALTHKGLSLQANVVELKGEGVHQVIAARKRSMFTFVFDEDGEHVFRRGPKSAVKRGTVDYGMREQQFAKALVVVGVPKAEPVKPAGLPIELVPADGPAKWRSGRTLRFRALCGGKPLAHEQVLATRVGFRPADAWCFAAETDGQGVVAVPVKEAGTWVLRVERRKLAAGKARAEYDYDTLLGTLALEVRP